MQVLESSRMSGYEHHPKLQLLQSSDLQHRNIPLFSEIASLFSRIVEQVCTLATERFGKFYAGSSNRVQPGRAEYNCANGLSKLFRIVLHGNVFQNVLIISLTATHLLVIDWVLGTIRSNLQFVVIAVVVVLRRAVELAHCQIENTIRTVRQTRSRLATLHVFSERLVCGFSVSS